MTYKEYYHRLKQQRRKMKKQAHKGTGETLHQKGMYDQPKRNAGDSNYINTPPMQNPPNYTPSNTGQSR